MEGGKWQETPEKTNSVIQVEHEKLILMRKAYSLGVTQHNKVLFGFSLIPNKTAARQNLQTR